jgi:hypothetical protein
MNAIADNDPGMMDIGSDRRSHSFRGVSDQITPRASEMLEVLHDVFESLQISARNTTGE